VINLLQLGRVDYATALRLQEALVGLRKRDEIADTLLLLEHEPVITQGRNAKDKNLLATRAQLQRAGIELFESNRGGDVTYHGPGQLVGYPIFDLRQQKNEDGDRASLGAVAYVRKLEEVLMRTAAEYGIPTQRVAGMTGVWTRPIARQVDGAGGLRKGGGHAGESTGGRRSAEKKLAAIGVHISRGVTSHGFALNVSTDLEHFDLIVPCGLTGRQVTSLNREIEALYAGQSIRPLEVDEVAQAVARNFGRVFHRQILWLESLEALLPRAQPEDTPLQTPRELRGMRGEGETFSV
jgi:lipoyl(octanoyl) transferase